MKTNQKINMLFPLFLVACTDEIKPAEPAAEEGEFLVDNDGDGFYSDEDCDDNDSETYPGADELCDGFDNNCNGQADEDVKSTFYADADNDGFGNANITTQACEAPSGFVTQGTDCDDLDDRSYPGATEICDEIDNDCDAEIDEDQKNMFYIDADGDGFGVEENTIEACDLRIGLSSVTGDCDDLDAERSPIATEVCDEIDNNCNEEVDEGVTLIFYADFDEDNFGDPNQPISTCSRPSGYVENNTDCQDDDTLIHPSAIEICDEQDNDCNGLIDESGIDGTIWYEDGDEDGFGDPNSTLQSCSQPNGYLLDDQDCNDNDENIHPNQGEVCDGVDENCDGEIDNEPIIDINWFFDADGDGFGTIQTGVASCTQPLHHVENSDDCDDQDNDTYPNAPEYCNGEDNNCDEDGLIDENAVDALLVYPDVDQDGYGDQNQGTLMCSVEDGYTLDDNDCDDSVEIGFDINPDQLEICDGIDNDCNEQIDEQGGDEISIWYRDEDGDGFGNLQNPLAACGNPEGYVSNASDCDDSLTGTDIHPDATEICDGIDNNCDELVDDESSADATKWYRDADGDTFGDENNSLSSCSEPIGYVSNLTDCNDNEGSIHPDADELCNGVSDDCDEEIDEDALDMPIWYEDGDGDGFGVSSVSNVIACDQPDGYTLEANDCDDVDETIHPGLQEICDDIDNNCVDGIDEGLIGTAECPYQDCKDILAADSSSSSGLYTILSDGNPVETWCDMTTDGGGWTLVGYSYNDSTTTSSGNRNIYSLKCGGGTFQPSVRGATSAAIASVELAQGSSEIAFSFGSTSSTEDMNTYTYAWKFAIPDPSTVTFVNHSYYADFNSAGPCVAVTVEGIIGDSSTYSKYTLKNVLGTSWTDTYPTGYGASDTSTCVNHDGGPFVTSVHTGSHHYAWSGDLYNDCGIQHGSFNYNHKGMYYPFGSGKKGTAAIWLR